MGFEALHLETFLAAELSLALPHDRRIESEKGLYCDLFGSLGRVESSQTRLEAIVLVIE